MARGWWNSVAAAITTASAFAGSISGSHVVENRSATSSPTSLRGSATQAQLARDDWEITRACRDPMVPVPTSPIRGVAMVPPLQAPSAARTAVMIRPTSGDDRPGCTGSETTSFTMRPATGTSDGWIERVVPVAVVVEHDPGVVDTAAHTCRPELLDQLVAGHRRVRGDADGVLVPDMAPSRQLCGGD